MDQELNLIKEMKFDDIINQTLALYKKHFLFFIKILSYFFVPAIILMVLTTYRLIDLYTELFKNMDPASMSQQGAAGLLEMMGYVFIVSLVYTAFYLCVNAGVIRGIDDKLKGINTTEVDVAVATLKKLFPLFLTTIFAMMLMTFGFFFCVIPFFILAVYMTFVPQTVMLEDRWVFGAIGRSFSLVNGYFWSTFVIPLVYFFTYSFISSIITYGMLIIPYVNLFKSIMSNQGQMDPNFMVDFYQKYAYLFIIQVIANNIILLLMSPILNIALTLKYYNIRNLKEGTALINDIQQEKDHR